MMKTNTPEMEAMDKENFTIQYKKGMRDFGIGMTLFFVANLALHIHWWDETWRQMLWILISFFWVLFSIRWTLEYARWKLIVKGDSFTIHHWNGKIKTVTLDEISRVKPVFKGYNVYKDKKRILHVNNFMEQKQVDLLYQKLHEKISERRGKRR